MVQSKRTTYVRAPRVPEEAAERLRAVLEVLSGARTVSEAARQLGISRNHFQAVMHRGLQGLIEGLLPGRPGRPSRPEEESTLRRQVEQLRQENEHLRQRVETIDRLLGVASDVMKGRVAPMRRPRQKRASPKAVTKTPASDDEEPRRRLLGAEEMRKCGLTAHLAAVAVGRSSATLRRWRSRLERGTPPVRRRGPGPRDISLDVVSRAQTLVRSLRGLCGATALSRSVPGLSRRQAAALKQQTLTEMERERRNESRRVMVTVSGVVRGFDQLFLGTQGDRRVALVSADAHVPYRTSIALTRRYDSASVAAALEADFTLNGAPLVLRADRARAHKTDDVMDLLGLYGVLLLHGPARYPRYYGQLERQNREHRAYLASSTLDELEQKCATMLDALNGLWRRPTLHWKTAAEVWNARPRLNVNREDLRNDVNERAARIRRHLDPRARDAGLAERLAIEQALKNRGFLRCTMRGRC